MTRMMAWIIDQGYRRDRTELAVTNSDRFKHGRDLRMVQEQGGYLQKQLLN
eukprot:CAMPEP_0206471754 /NCGR_PEP_ID=MMETSP0324_2-20121206/31765_1 /ASSEMBLY_ACC=CAM_ASM_000836 /TAXON_ID=2866 /ORGANISM="Crypthecodinium cohnii, Strain Seligo" /LENGTH=50 /DNA_ID=CAMNT_0053946167 /DNA_START=16 /DNA_END=168 /DNA_ORIENTATION=-